jgi:Type I restriction modification DNA specificity domain
MKLVKLSEYFEIKYGVNLEFQNMKIYDRGIPFVSRTENNNGIAGFVEKINGVEPNPKNTISVACGGSVMESFLQKTDYYSGRDLFYLKPKISLTDNEMLFYCACLRANKYRYSYGRQANKTLAEIKIPSKGSIPEFVYKQKIKTISKEAVCADKIELNKETWKEFKLDILFDISGTKTTKLNILEKSGKGQYPYITTKAKNNGCDGFYDIKTEGGDVITIDSAVAGYASYQSEDFSASDHVEKLTLRGTLNKYIAMFLTTILNKEGHRFYYGRGASQERLRNLNIRLPATL